MDGDVSKGSRFEISKEVSGGRECVGNFLKRKECRWELLRFRNDVKYIQKTFEGLWNV